MDAGLTLREYETQALDNNQFISDVNGVRPKTKKKKIKSFGAAGLLTAMLVIFAVALGTGNMMPNAISERLIEETDVQNAFAVESKFIVLQQAMREGDIPEDTATLLREDGVIVGCIINNSFSETNKCNGELVLKMSGKIISADDFINEVHNNVNLYAAVNKATYSRAAYYYDEAAQKVFQKIGTTRNNYTSESDFNETMSSVLGEGSDIKVNSVSETEDKEGNKSYQENGAAATTKTSDGEFINTVKSKILGSDNNDATLATADALKVADTISKEQRSSLFFLAFMENISKMKAGKGNESKINDAMNFLTTRSDSKVVDIKTGETKIIKDKSPLDSPSLYAILSGGDLDMEAIGNYSSDRILKIAENKLNISYAESIHNTVSAASNKVTGVIGKYVTNGLQTGSDEVLSLTQPIISESLIDNSFETIRGVNAGEFLVEGAINVGKELAKASGATMGDADAVNSYARLNNTILAMDAKVERLEKNPFDITSKNTFLGSIVYNFALALSKNSSWFGGVKVFANTIKSSVASFWPTSYADNTKGYLSNFGDCETYNTIRAVGSAQCAEIATFDTSTLNNPYSNPEFIAFIENNTTLSSSGTRTINPGSVLGNFIKNNNEKITPMGVTDGSVLASFGENLNSLNYTSNILEMIKRFLGASDEEKRIATGEEYVNSKNNPNWQNYKWAQLYVSLARTTAILRQYTDNPTAYNNILYFEGSQNPVMAYLDQYCKVAEK